MLNGPLGGSRLVHFCHASVGCRCSGRDQSVKRIAQCVMKLVYPHRPRIPQLSEWTSCLDSLRFMSLGALLAGLHRKVFERSISRSCPVSVASSSLQLVPAAQAPLTREAPQFAHPRYCFASLCVQCITQYFQNELHFGFGTCFANPMGLSSFESSVFHTTS